MKAKTLLVGAIGALGVGAYKLLSSKRGPKAETKAIAKQAKSTAKKTVTKAKKTAGKAKSTAKKTVTKAKKTAKKAA
jgi:hypothetical protein